jgi:hypothetical protein
MLLEKTGKCQTIDNWTRPTDSEAAARLSACPPVLHIALAAQRYTGDFNAHALMWWGCTAVY